MGGVYNKIFRILTLLLVVLFSCGKSDDAITDDLVVDVDKTQSVLILMLSNNNLYSYSVKNIDSLVRNYNYDHYKTGNMVVYQRGIGETPQLLLINNDTAATVIKSYESHVSCDPTVIRQVIDDFKELFPAQDYGCVLWSHGSGWLPSEFTGSNATTYTLTTTSSNISSSLYAIDDIFGDIEFEYNIENHPLYGLIRDPYTKAFGQDGDDWIEIVDLVNTLYDDEFNFILFDACYMNSIEVAYEIRNKAKWLLGSPNEVLSNGFNYSTLGYNLFLDKPIKERLMLIGDDFVSKYSQCTMSLINLDNMDNFAAKYSAILDSVPDYIGSATPSNVQRYDRYSNHVIFDLSDYIATIAPEYSDQIDSMLEDIVEYKYATSYFLYISLEKFCGISSYIPFEYYTALTPQYKELGWWKDVMEKN